MSATRSQCVTALEELQEQTKLAQKISKRRVKFVTIDPWDWIGNYDYSPLTLEKLLSPTNTTSFKG